MLSAPTPDRPDTLQLLENCGALNIEYTRGVLDALGYHKLAVELSQAAKDFEAFATGTLGSTDDIKARHAARINLFRAQFKLEAIRDQMRAEPSLKQQFRA